MSRTERTEVLVVGAGPVGLLTALRLSRLGVEVRVVDQSRRTGTHSYALALHKATQRLLAGERLLAGLERTSCRVSGMALYRGPDRQEPLALAGGERDLDVLVVPQSRLEQALEEALSREGVQVEWRHRLESLDPDASTARVSRLEPVTSGYPVARTEWVVGRAFDLSAELIFGADGTRSTVRRALGLDLQHAAPAQRFSVYEFESGAGKESEAHLVLDRDGISVLWPLPDGRRRWSFEIGEESEHRAGADGLQSRIAERAPWFRDEPGPIRWSSPVTFPRCLADSFGRGRTWLAGDAAHLTGPVGVQSLNAGLAEALELAEAAAGSASGRDEALAAYGRDSHARWRRLLQIEGSLDTTGARDAWIGGEAGRLLACLPATGADLAELMGRLGVGFDPGP